MTERCEKKKERYKKLLARAAVAALALFVMYLLIQAMGGIGVDSQIARWINQPITELKIGQLVALVWIISLLSK